MPVLSEQMTEVQPRVSTEGRDLTMAFFLAIRRVPRARQVVMTAGRPGEESNVRERDQTAGPPQGGRSEHSRGLGEGGGLTLGDGGHGQSHSDLEVVDGTTDPGASMDGVVEVANVDGPHGDANEGDDLGQLLAELVKLGLEGGLLLLGGGHLVTDFTDLSAYTGGHGNSDSLAGGDVGALWRNREEEGKERP